MWTPYITPWPIWLTTRRQSWRLSREVFLLDVLTTLPGRHLEWSARNGCVFVLTGDAGLVCVAWIVLRDGKHDARSALIGRIGGAMTHLAHSRQSCFDPMGGIGCDEMGLTMTFDRAASPGTGRFVICSLY